MSSKQRHEYELKFKIGTQRGVIPAMREKLQRVGFHAGTRAIETDYLPDTSDDACKNAKILLRFRQVENVSSQELLLTLKVKQDDGKILHFREYETDLHEPDTEMIVTINKLLQSHVGLSLDKTITDARTLEEVRRACRLLGFTKQRILLAKYRENFSLGKDNATVDYFPDNMGVYVEFESHSPEALRLIIKRAGFDISIGISTDYGDLLKQHKDLLKVYQQRTALFLKPERKLLTHMIRDLGNE